MTEKLEHRVLIIPDVHCRAFWKADIDWFRNEIESGYMMHKTVRID